MIPKQGITTNSSPAEARSRFDDLNEEVAVFEQQDSRQGGHQQTLGSSLAEARIDLDDLGLNVKVAVCEPQCSRQGR